MRVIIDIMIISIIIIIIIITISILIMVNIIIGIVLLVLLCKVWTIMVCGHPALPAEHRRISRGLAAPISAVGVVKNKAVVRWRSDR